MIYLLLVNIMEEVEVDIIMLFVKILENGIIIMIVLLLYQKKMILYLDQFMFFFIGEKLIKKKFIN